MSSKLSLHRNNRPGSFVRPQSFLDRPGAWPTGSSPERFDDPMHQAWLAEITDRVNRRLGNR